MNAGPERTPLTLADLYRIAFTTEFDTEETFDPQHGLDRLQAWIDQEVDLVEANTESPTTRPVPRVKVRGRHQLLEDLAALARQPETGPLVLVGQGGAGKSTLAAALAEQAQRWDREVFWVSAASSAEFFLGIRTVVRSLGGSDAEAKSIANGTMDAADRFWRLLENTSRDWLLIFDNADDPWILATAKSGAGVQGNLGWARTSRRGQVVVTSRETDVRMWTGARTLKVGGLDPVDAAQVLRDLAPQAGTDNEAQDLARQLDGLPLTLYLAGTYLRSEVAEILTFTDYQHALGRDGKSVIACAVEISLDGLASHGNPQARNVLELASCYASNSIPTSILSGTGLQEALDGLGSVGLIHANWGGITLHPLITRAGRAHKDGQHVWHTAVTQLSEASEKLRFGLPQHWSQFRELGHHLLAVLEAAYQLNREHLALLADTALTVARAFSRSGAGQAALAMCESVLKHCRELGEDHPAVLRAWHLIGWVVADAGDVAQAEAIYVDLVDRQSRVLGPTHPDTIHSRHELAWIATCFGRWEEAEQGYRVVLSDSLAHLDPDNEDMLTTRHELAHATAAQGRLDEALAAFEEVLQDRRRVLGEHHPQTLQSQHEIAWIAARYGDWKRAEVLYRQLLEARREMEGDHPHVLLTFHELAWTIARQGRSREAESIYRHVLERRSRTLGSDHPDTAKTRWALEELLHSRIVDATHLA